MLHFVQEGNLMDVITSDLEWETFSESSSSSEDHEDVDYLFGGQARNIFSSLQESIGKIDDFLSFERLFVYGEIVRYAAFPSGQMGRVTGIDMFVDLENLHGKVLKNVNTKKLSKFCSISENDYVILGPWLGRVNKVVDKVIIVFDDGTRCEVSAPEKEKVVPINSDLLEDSQYPYYPGQRVRIKSPNSSKPTGWLCGNWKENQVEGTILSVEAGSVYVNWLASALSGSDQSLPMPPCWQDSKQITLLSCFSHANWQLGDWCVVPPISDCKLLMGQFVFDSAIADTDKEQANIRRGLKKGNFGSFDEVYCIVKTKTKVDVLWQDGTHSIGLDSQNLLPVSVTNAHEFWPMQFVIERGTFDDPRKSTSRRWGVVQSMDAKERTVRLQWQSIPITETEDFAGDRLEETVSAYELIEHPDYSYCYGDIVFKAAQKQLGYLANQDHSKSITGLNAGAAFKDRLCINCGNDLLDKCYLCCIGNVTGFGDGTVDVKWANGFTMKVAPHEIFKIDKNEDASSTSVLNEANADVLTREMVEHEDSYQIKKGKGLSSFDSEEKSFQKHPQESRSFVLPRAAVEFFSSIKMSIFRSLGVTSMSKSFSVLHDAIDGREPENLKEKGLLEASDLFADPEESELQSAKTSLDEEGTEFQEQKYISSPRNGDLSDHFKQFGIISDCGDHQFFNASKWSTLSQPKRGWMKKVQQEWSILEKNLPETIYVRVYEERMDLLRAAIIGAPGTPYHDGIFFFDICFPPEYPYQPPMVHYYSGGLRVNPNLYESGKVCLSLLNTWTGSGTEVWNPSSSTVLQVLLSLQALVLNDKPYFNEAGYDKQIGRVEGEKNSVSYNENAFLLSCKTMVYILKKPPKHFEALVQEHFNKRAQYIMLACKSYLEGASMGCASGCESEQESGKGTSTGFKIMLGKLFPKLVEAFSENGIDCSQFRGP